MAFGIDDILIALSLSAVTGAIGGALAPSIPAGPDLAKSTRAGAEAEAETLPGRLAVERAARLGTSVSYPTGRTTPTFQEQQFAVAGLQGTTDAKGMFTLEPKLVPYVPEEWQAGGKYGGQGQPKIITQRVQTGLLPQTASADFTGRGEIQNQQLLAQQMAKAQLELGRKYGPQFVEEALKQERLADPEGVAARELLYNKIMERAGRTPEIPVARTLDEQLRGELQLGTALDPQAEGLTSTLSNRAAIGDVQTPDLLRQSLEQGAAGQERLAGRQQRSTSFLSSGATPQDVEYRRRQQSLADLSSFLRGETPQAQFGQLSGAQRGAAPFITGPTATGYNSGSEGQVAAGAAGNYAANVRQLAQQANPWFAGISLALKGAGTYAAGQQRN